MRNRPPIFAGGLYSRSSRRSTSPWSSSRAAVCSRRSVTAGWSSWNSSGIHAPGGPSFWTSTRAWGWHTLGAGAGIDFPFLSWQLAHGRTVPEIRGQQGVRWVRAITDVPAAAAEIRRGRLSLPAYLRSLRPPFQCAVLALGDPVPALTELPTLLHHSTSRGSLWQRTKGIFAASATRL
jgi:hypothetical protein